VKSARPGDVMQFITDAQGIQGHVSNKAVRDDVDTIISKVTLRKEQNF
jgi:UDP-glucose 4-epimerase